MQFNAFLSYSRKNLSIAERIQHELESYRIPKKFRSNKRKNTFEIFRDVHDVELGDYSHVIKEALSASEFLIILCSPASRQSSYVSDEIKKFMDMPQSKANQIIPILIEGRPNNEVSIDDPIQDKAFPEILYDYFKEPIAADYRKHSADNYFSSKTRRREAFFQVVAKLLDTQKSEELVQRDRLKRIILNSIIGSLILLLSITGSWLYYDNIPKSGLSLKWWLFSPESKKNSTRSMDDLIKSLKENIPPKLNDKRLLVATWNIKHLGRKKTSYTRTNESINYITQIMSSFDVIAIQEIQANSTELGEILHKLLNRLGPHWLYFGSGTVEGRLGNNERLGFLFDSRSLDSDKTIDEVVLPQELMEKTGLNRQISRTPTLANFSFANHNFVVANAHIIFGDSGEKGRQQRLREFSALAEYLRNSLTRKRLSSDQLILLGDLNFERSDVPQVAEAQKQEFFFPKNLLSIPTNTFKNSRPYDQILLSWNEQEIPPCVSNYGAYDFFDVVYKIEDFQYYQSTIKNWRININKRNQSPKKITNETLLKDYKRWKLNQISDHKPKWIELDYSCNPDSKD